MRVLRTLVMLSLAGWVLAACSSEEAPAPSAQGAAQKTAMAAAPPPVDPTEEPQAEYRYDPTGKPDPFRSFIKLQQLMITGDPTTPLERFDLSQLMVTAIIWGTDRPRALIEDPSGKGHIVSTGTPIGKNKGRVVSIEDNLVLVKETYVDFRDRATTKEVELRLYESQGG